MQVSEILKIAYLWFRKMRQTDAGFDSEGQKGRIPKQTFTDWYNFCREVCRVKILNDWENGEQLGKPGMIVEIDESAFDGVEKFGLGESKSKTMWVFGAIERTEDGSPAWKL